MRKKTFEDSERFNLSAFDTQLPNNSPEILQVWRYLNPFIFFEAKSLNKKMHFLHQYIAFWYTYSIHTCFFH